MIQVRFLLKNSVFTFLANIIFLDSHLKLHPAVHLNTLASKALVSLH